MRALLPDLADDVDVHAEYARDWVEPGGFRVNFVSSADGAAQAGGKSAGLQTPGDNVVFTAIRDLADVIVAGAATATIEGYRAIRVRPDRLGVRRDYGFRDALPTAVVSRSLRFDPQSRLFADAAADARTIVITCEAAPADRRTALAQVADVAVCGGELVEMPLARAALEDRGLTRIVCEGGPIAFAHAAVDGVMDELCLSLTPRLVGPGPTRIIAGDLPWEAQVPLRLTGLLEEDGALFLRYAAAGT